MPTRPSSRVPDERWGETGVAFVVLAVGTAVSGEELLAHCRERLARSKVPRAVRFVPALPRSGTSKVLKDELRARLAEEASA